MVDSIGCISLERPVEALQHMPSDAFDALRDIGIRLYSYLIPRADRDAWDLKYLRGFQHYLHSKWWENLRPSSSVTVKMHGSNFSLKVPHFSTTILLIHLHLMFFALARAAPLEVTMPKNLTESSRCTRSQDWQAYAFLVEDCYTAIQRLYIEEVLKNPDAIYEFITTGTYPQTRHPWKRTPIEYTVSEYHSVPNIDAVVGIFFPARFGKINNPRG